MCIRDRYTSFCEQVEVDGVRRDKYVRQTRREIDEGTVREVYEEMCIRDRRGKELLNQQIDGKGAEKDDERK